MSQECTRGSESDHGSTRADSSPFKSTRPPDQGGPSPQSGCHHKSLAAPQSWQGSSESSGEGTSWEVGRVTYEHMDCMFHGLVGGAGAEGW